MRLCEYIKSQRNALEMSQAEIAEIVGLDESVISKFEDGEELPEHIYKQIKGKLRDYIGRLDKERRLQVSVLTSMHSLRYQSTYEKRRQLTYIMRDIGKMGVDLYKIEKREEEES